MQFTVSEEVAVKATQEEVFAFHGDFNNISRVVPSFIKIQVKQLGNQSIEEGSEAVLSFKLFGKISILKWHLKIKKWNPPESFIDDEIGGIFQYFSHEHKFNERGTESSIQDTITYFFQCGIFSNFINKIVLKLILKLFLKDKLAATKKALEQPKIKNHEMGKASS